MNPSGVIPRTLMEGIVWDEAAEKNFVAHAAELSKKYQWAEDQILQEARWFIEGALHRQFIKTQVSRASICTTADAKRALMREWTTKYGAARAERLARMVKHDGLKKAILETW